MRLTLLILYGKFASSSAVFNFEIVGAIVVWLNISSPQTFFPSRLTATARFAKYNAEYENQFPEVREMIETRELLTENEQLWIE